VIALLMGLRTISPGDLHRLVQERGVRVFDVNAPGRWLEGRVPGAVNLDPAAFGAADLPADKAVRLVFYCSNPLCRKAPNAALRAKKLGYENVSVMSAGITGWVGARLPVESGPPAA
jgi:rhodanese-related sulfurtransferase